MQHGELSLERALAERRSRRSYRPVDLSVEELSQLFWAAQGVTHGDGCRTAPSAGALFPLEVYAALRAGLFHYVPTLHAAESVGEGDYRAVLRKHALSQQALAEAACAFVFCAVFRRLRAKYGGDAERYAYLEAGHAAQNLLLQACSLGLGAVAIGAFDEVKVRVALGLPEEETPIYLVAVGVPR
jgi:SagB-type dehydrogenase family enzyme